MYGGSQWYFANPDSTSHDRGVPAGYVTPNGSPWEQSQHSPWPQASPLRMGWAPRGYPYTPYTDPMVREDLYPTPMDFVRPEITPQQYQHALRLASAPPAPAPAPSTPSWGVQHPPLYHRSHSPWIAPATSSMNEPVVISRSYPYHAKNLSPIPPDWRDDFGKDEMKGWLKRRASRSRLDQHLEPSELNYMINMTPSNKFKHGLVALDLRDSGNPPAVDFLQHGLSTEFAMQQLATTFPVNHLRFYHVKLPWYIDVWAQQSHGITINDVLSQLMRHLHQCVRLEDFYNSALDSNKREDMSDSYRARCGDDISLLQHGLLRVDFLGDDCILQGFQRGKNGMWVIKTTTY